MKAKLLLSAAPMAMMLAAAAMTPTTALAGTNGRAVGQNANLLAIVICSNNGGGNLNEIVTFGAEPTGCLKFQDTMVYDASNFVPGNGPNSLTNPDGNPMDFDPNFGIPQVPD